jgi:hypothetical protein
VGILRRLLGGDGDNATPAARPQTQQQLDDEERTYELDLARFEQDRTTDLVRRQQRYSDKSWTPPAQGGAIRAGEEDGGADSAPDGG